MVPNKENRRTRKRGIIDQEEELEMTDAPSSQTLTKRGKSITTNTGEIQFTEEEFDLDDANADLRSRFEEQNPSELLENVQTISAYKKLGSKVMDAYANTYE